MTAPDTAFAPPRWLGNAHVQTLLAVMPPRLWGQRGARSEAHLITLPGTQDRLYGAGLWRSEPGPAVILVHGVGGASDSPYLVRCAWTLVRAGFHVVSLNLRGCGPGAPLAGSLYHAGMAGDIAAAVQHVAGLPAVTAVGLMGMSLGGQMALLTAANWHEAPPPALRAVAAISAPFDLAPACRHLDEGRPVYRDAILKGLVTNARRLGRRAPERLPVPESALRRIRRLYDFDDQIIAPMHGFASAADYYARVSCGPQLARIRVPTLVVHAEDD
ncbi:MAG TPA: alpha/beta fold hydrolase, partial [Myxococcota bacterium]|nr:alpha/beta fold hydrolase [Myxococcota bacterium]